MNTSLVTVNILSFNRKDELRQTLTKVFEQDYKNIEVIVVDNASTDGSAEMVEQEFPQVNLVRLDKNIGIAGWNKGFEIAKGDYVLVLDDDSYPENGAIEKGVLAFQRHKSLAVVAFNIINFNNGISENIVFGEKPLSFIGCGALLNTTIIKEVNGFCSLYFIYHNELDLSARLKNLGYEILFLRDAKVIHKKNVINDYGILRDRKRFLNFTKNTYLFITLRLSGLEKFFSIVKWTVNRLIICVFFSYWDEFFQAINKLLLVKKQIKECKKIISKDLQREYGRNRFPLVDRTFFPEFRKEDILRGEPLIKTVVWLKSFLALLFLIITEKLFRNSHNKNTNKNKNKDLVLINLGYIGDVIVSTVFVENESLLDEFQNIVFIVRKDILKLFASYNGRISFFPLDINKAKFSVKYIYELYKYFKKYNFLYSFVLTPTRTIRNDIIANITSPQKKYALFLHSKIIKVGKKWIDKKYDKIICKEKINEYDKNYCMLKFISGNLECLSFYNNKTFPLFVRKLKSQKKILISPFSSTRNRDWPIIKFIQLIKRIINDFDITLIGSKNQEKDLMSISEELNDKINIISDMDLSKLYSVFSEISIFIGIDSGLTHIALKLGIPIIAIIGGGNFNRFFPYKSSNKVIYLYEKLSCFNCEWKCIYHEKYCITKVDVEDVENSIKKIMQTMGSNEKF